MITLEEVRSLATTLPRTTEALVQGRVKFRVGRIVYLAFSRDETVMGFAFPKEWRQALVESEPDKFVLPRTSDLRFNWVCVRLAAIDSTEMHELVIDAWGMVVPKRVAKDYRLSGKEHAMTLPPIGSQDDWLAAREALQAKEDQLARTRETLIAERRRLPMVEVERDYAFEGAAGRAGLLDLFDERSQLLVYHFWFEPGESPCDGCSLWVSNLGDIANLHARDTSMVLVSRAPSPDLQAVKERRGWTIPWFSPVGSEFNDDAGYAGAAQITVFVRDGERIYRTYVTSGRTLETIGNHWTLLDLTPLGEPSE